VSKRGPERLLNGLRSCEEFFIAAEPEKGWIPNKHGASVVCACYNVTEEEYAFTHHCGSFGRRFWPLCYGLNHRLAREFHRDETDQHTLTR
jgi:hypothetical protein